MPRRACTSRLCKGLLLLLSLVQASAAQDLEPGVRGVAVRAPAGVRIDGDLSEFAAAMATPVEYFHPDLANRAAQFFYMWDERAFYAALRTLDEPTKQANHGADDRLWEGDAVEWYFDTRRGTDFRNSSWPRGPEAGALHGYWTAFTGTDLEPRFGVRPGYENQVPREGIEVAARRTAWGVDIELALPWANFPAFEPAAGEVIAIDAETCYSDGEGRVDRSFVFGNPLSVSQPASLARVQLVESLERVHWGSAGPVMMPLRVDVPWRQDGVAEVVARIAMPPNHGDLVGKVAFRIVGLDGATLAEHFAQEDPAFPAGSGFARREARWPIDSAPPGGHHVVAIVYDVEGDELSRVAPRLVSVGMQQGY
jgi:hypothetical protein